VQRAMDSVPNVAAMISILKKQGVFLSVDSVAVPLLEIAGATVGFESNFIVNAAANAQKDGISIVTAVSRVQQVDAELGLKAAAAVEVLYAMLWQVVRHDGRMVSLGAARAYASSQYDTYKTSPLSIKKKMDTANLLGWPAGTSIEQEFLSPKAVQARQMMMSIEAEETAIAGPPRYKGSSGVLISRTPKLVTWMTHALASHRVSIKGIPGITPTNIVKALPSGL